MDLTYFGINEKNTSSDLLSLSFVLLTLYFIFIINHQLISLATLLDQLKRLQASITHPIKIWSEYFSNNTEPHFTLHQYYYVICKGCNLKSASEQALNPNDAKKLWSQWQSTREFSYLSAKLNLLNVWNSETYLFNKRPMSQNC